MKKFLLISAAALMLAACSKETAKVAPAQQNIAVSDTPITFSMNAVKGSRIDSVATETLQAGFKCQAYYNDGTVYANNADVEYVNSKYQLTSYYWPAEGTLSFYCVYPAATIEEAKTFDVEVSRTDIVAAKAEDVANGTTANLSFNHLLSWVSGVQFQSSELDSTGVSKVEVKEVTFRAPSKATYDFVSGDFKSKSQKDTLDFSYTTTSQVVTDKPSQSKYTAINGTDYMLLPSVKTDDDVWSTLLTVKYEITTHDTVLSFTKTANIELKAGKKHTIKANLINDKEFIQFTVDVEEWVDEDIDVPSFN